MSKRLFRVEIERLIADRERGPMFNPFMAGDALMASNSNYIVRSWDMEASDENEIRDFFNEAKAQRLSNVDGFELRSIREITS